MGFDCRHQHAWLLHQVCDHYPPLTADRCLEVPRTLCCLVTSGEKQWLLDYFIMNSSAQSKQAELTYMICGKSVCFKLWVATLDISNSYFYSVKRLFLNGHKRVIQHVQHAPLLRTSEALAWLGSFFTCMGDRMPDRPTVHLPSSLSKVSIYNEMVDDLRRRGKDVVISQSQFFEVWKSTSATSLSQRYNVMCYMVM